MAVTGELEALGLEFHAAERLAVGDFNRYLAEKNAGWSLKLVHEDAESLPPVALEKIESLHAQGIPVVLGPLDSASLQFSRGYIVPTRCWLSAVARRPRCLPFQTTRYEGATGMITLGEAAMHDPSDKGQITIGGIVPLTGDASLHGQQLKAAMKHAEAEFNQYLEENNIGWNLDVVVADSQTSPGAALDHLARQHADGISAVVGPYSSAELAAMKDYADSNEMIIISPSSSAPSLAIPGDNVFRLIPDDTQNGHVFAKLFEATEMETVIPIWRGDIWGDGLVGVARESFAELGGSMDDGVRYDPDTTDFSEDVAALSDIVRRHMDAGDDRKIGVLVLSFQEVVPLIQAALLHDNLDDVVWFGSSTPANDELIDPAVIEFVHAVQISSPRYELFPNPTLDELNAVVSETTGQVPLVYVAGAYDAVWILGLSILESGSAGTGAVLEAMPGVLDGYDGALGRVSLNEAGDLATISYGIYQFEDSAWQSVGTYDGTTDTVTLDMPPEAGTGPDTGSGAGPNTETVPEASPGGGCLIATAAYGSELAPNVQMLREIRDGTLLSTASGTSFVTGFSQVYYSFSPAIADLERENPAFRDAVRMINHARRACAWHNGACGPRF